jgi:hypothetical protein
MEQIYHFVLFVEDNPVKKNKKYNMIETEMGFLEDIPMIVLIMYMLFKIYIIYKNTVQNMNIATKKIF